MANRYYASLELDLHFYIRIMAEFDSFEKSYYLQSLLPTAAASCLYVYIVIRDNTTTTWIARCTHLNTLPLRSRQRQ